MTDEPVKSEIATELEDLRARLFEAEDALHAIRNAEVDAVMVTGKRGEQVYTLTGADRIYRQLIETMSESALTLSKDGIILFANVRFAEMLGQSLDQVMGTTLRSYLQPADQQALDAILAQCNTETIRREINLKSSDSRQVPVYVSASCLQDEGAGIVFCLVLTDLTEQKSHEQIVAEERLARLILEQSTGAIIVCDKQGRVIRASQAAQQFSAGSLLLRLFSEAFPIRTINSGAFHIDPVLRGETLRNMDVTLDGQMQKIDLILNAGPLRSDRQIFGCVVTLTDITERKQAEAKIKSQLENQKQVERGLQESERKYRELVNNLNDVIFMVNSANVITYISPRILQLSGFEAENLIGRPFSEFVCAEDLPGLERSLHETLDNRLEPWEFRYCTKAGEIRWARTSSRPVMEDGSITGIQGVLSDITERKRGEAKMKEQLDELRRWHEVTLGRETRVIELKREVNELLGKGGQAPRYESSV